MVSVDWMIDFAFDFPVDCTPAMLLERLEYFSADWPGWENFPWRVTRSIHKFLDHPPVNFHYLTIHRCLQGYAAHLVLNSTFRSRPEVLAVMIREKCEIVGLLRILLIDALRYEMRFTKTKYIRDCSGPEDWYEPVSPEELEKRRAAFRECIEGAVLEFARILDLMSVAENMKAQIYGRTLRYWACGGEMPEAVKLPVLVEMTVDGKVLRPCKAELAVYSRGGFLPPGVLVERVNKASGAKGLGPRGEDSTAKAAKPPTPEASARQGGSEEEVSGQQSAVSSEALSGRGLVKKVKAGRERAVVKDARDRRAIRAAVKCLLKMGLSQTEACRQVSDQVKKGRAGEHTLTMKYDAVGFEASPMIVRRVARARW